MSALHGHVRVDDVVRALVGDLFDLVASGTYLLAELIARREPHRLGQVPNQLMELAHDTECLEHALRDRRIASPVTSTECHLGDLLPRSETVVHGTPGKAP